MKRIIYPLVVLSLAVLACNLPGFITPVPPPVVTEPPVIVTEPPVVTANVNCNELSLYLDPALASGYNCQTIPQSVGGMTEYPQYTRLVLQGYPLPSDEFNPPNVSVFSIAQYNALFPSFSADTVAPLQALIGGAAPPNAIPPSGPGLPYLVMVAAGQLFHGQYLIEPFANGNGIRYLTQFAQNYAPINNTDLIYTYQGLTSDGLYWVSVTLPITNPILPANGETLPGGESWQQFSDNFPTYITDLTTQLNSQAPGSFSPTLSMLDALVASIVITP